MREKEKGKAELLAPGGSAAGIRAAVNAGADAVYAGGRLFGARAYADNPDEEGMADCIDYCHLHGAKFYLTVNTLLKEEELEKDLYDYLLPIYERGADAVLVQDLGVFRYLKTHFPDLPIHASTQMTVTGPDGVRLLHRMGAERVVLSRELSLEEIREIRRQTDAELETFVHGALCFCYSGQCLMSSMLGGRSGNRGRCAQPCRLPWRFDGPDGGNGEACLLSLKDICTLDILPDLIDAGISSLKIEGRMKRPEYAAGVTSVYRKYIDLYDKAGRKGYAVDPQDRRILLDLFNRGGFSEGYYGEKNGPDMMAADRPDHCGTRAGEVRSVSGRRITVKASEDLYEGDLLQTGRIQFAVPPGEVYGPGREFSCPLPVLQQEDRRASGGGRRKTDPGSLRRAGGEEQRKAVIPVRKGDPVFRIRAQHLLDELKNTCVDRPVLLEASGSAAVLAGQSAELSVSCRAADGRICRVSASGAIAQKAEKRPLTEEEIRRQLEKTGDSLFAFRSLAVRTDGCSFLPVSELNRLRRQALSKLRQEMLLPFLREAPAEPAARTFVPAEPEEGRKSARNSVRAEAEGPKEETMPALTVSVMTMQQLEAALSFGKAAVIFLDSSMLIEKIRAARSGPEEEIRRLIDRIHKAGAGAYLAFPVIWRAETEAVFSRFFPPQSLRLFDGVLVRSMDQLNALAGWKSAGAVDTGMEVIADAGLYTWNHEAREALRSLGVTMDTVPYELTAGELKARGCAGSMAVIYGRTPLMISAQCQVKNSTGCRHTPGWGVLTDRKGASFPVKNDCTFCVSRIWNSVPLDLRPFLEEIAASGVLKVRVDLTDEDRTRTLAVLNGTVPVSFTRGHYRKGVE